MTQLKIGDRVRFQSDRHNIPAYCNLRGTVTSVTPLRVHWDCDRGDSTIGHLSAMDFVVVEGGMGLWGHWNHVLNEWVMDASVRYPKLYTSEEEAFRELPRAEVSVQPFDGRM